MKEAVNLGMSKFNIATEYFRTMYQSIEKRINNQEFEGNGVKLMYDIKEEMIDFLCKLSIGKRDVNEKSNPPAMLGRME